MGLFSLIGGIIAGGGQKKASKKAAQLQYDAAMAGVKETGRQFDVTRQDYAPYQALGTGATSHYGDLLGLNGGDAQGAEIAALRESPFYKSLYSNGENAVLANASATGGLRGGDTKHSLYSLGEDTLTRAIMQQLGNYGQAIGFGEGATGAVAGFGANAVAQENDLRNQGAGAKAQDVLTRAGINAANWNNAGSFLDNVASSFIPGGGGAGAALSKLF